MFIIINIAMLVSIERGAGVMYLSEGAVSQEGGSIL